MSMSVRMLVVLVRKHITEITCPNPSNFSVHVAVSRSFSGGIVIRYG